MQAHIKAEEAGVHLGQTVDIDVGNITIHRGLRPRRRLEVDVCGFKGCNEVAVAVGRWRGKRMFLLCEQHLSKTEKMSGDWNIVSRDEAFSRRVEE